MVERDVKGKILEYKSALHKIRYRKANNDCSRADLVDMALWHNISPQIIQKSDKIDLINKINDEVHQRNVVDQNDKGGYGLYGTEIGS